MNFAELLTNPSMMHAAVVHMPIAAVVFGLIFIGLSAIFHRNNTVRAMTALMFLLAAASAYVGIETGESARDLVPNTVSKAISDQITAHANHAENVMYASIFTLACLLISLIRVDTVRIIGLLLAAIGAVVANVFVAQTGHLGGTLVYNEGVGTPMIHQVAAPAPPAVEAPVVIPDAPVEAPVEPAPEEPEMPAEPIMEVPVEPLMEPEPPVEAAPVADDPEWVPIRDFTPEEAQQISYKNDVWPIIDDQCIVCHKGKKPDGQFLMTSVADIMKGGKKGGPGIIPGRPDESSIVHYIRGIVNPRMPEDEPPLTEDMLHTIRMWIAAGAIDDSDPPAATEASPAPEATPEPEPDTATEVPAEEMNDAVPAATTEPATEAAPAAEEMKDEAPAATGESAPAEEMKEEAPAAAGEAAVGAETSTETSPLEDAPAAVEESTESATGTPAEGSDAGADTASEAAEETATESVPEATPAAG